MRCGWRQIIIKKMKRNEQEHVLPDFKFSSDHRKQKMSFWVGFGHPMFVVCRVSLSGSTALAKYTFSTLSFINVSYIKRLQNNSILMRISLPVSLLYFSPFMFHNSDYFSVTKKEQHSADASILFFFSSFFADLFFEMYNTLSSS